MLESSQIFQLGSERSSIYSINDTDTDTKFVV